MRHHLQHDNFLNAALEKRREEGLLRQLSYSDGGVDFCSNDYLGFAQGPEKSYPVGRVGATGSRLVSGNSPLAEETEAFLAAWHGAEAALIFNTGYMANVGFFGSVADRNSTFIYDEQVHASIIDGMRLSGAKRYKFAHNDAEDLERKLRQATGRKFVVVESVYSMDGDLAPLPRIARICEAGEAALIVDEAHATGIYGAAGRGLVSHHGLEAQVWARIHTFGKALGLHGAVILGSALLRRFLVNHARPFIYTTALPPYVYAHIRGAYEQLEAAGQEHLFSLIEYFKKEAASLQQRGISLLVNPSPIQGILVPGNARALELAGRLRGQGLFVKAILSPTVAAGTERIRLCLHAFNTPAQVDQLIHAVKSYFP